MVVSFIQNSNCIDILGFCIDAVFTEKNMAHILVTNLLPG